jgi:hypothetical protein
VLLCLVAVPFGILGVAVANVVWTVVINLVLARWVARLSTSQCARTQRARTRLITTVQTTFATATPRISRSSGPGPRS